MRTILVLILLVLSVGAYAQFNKCGHGFCPNSLGGHGFVAVGGGVAPLTNLRITNTGDFRITSSGDNRAVSP